MAPPSGRNKPPSKGGNKPSASDNKPSSSGKEKSSNPGRGMSSSTDRASSGEEKSSMPGRGMPSSSDRDLTGIASSSGQSTTDKAGYSVRELTSEIVRQMVASSSIHGAEKTGLSRVQFAHGPLSQITQSLSSRPEKSSGTGRAATEKSSDKGQPATQLASPAGPSSQNLQQKLPAQNKTDKEKVIEYLVKKGYNKTEQTLRQESAHVDKDGRPIHNRVEELGNIKYTKGFKLLSDWINKNLDLYKFELRRLPWPIFVYSYLDLIINDAVEDGEMFFREFSPQFEKVHADELRIFETVKLRSLVFEDSTCKLYRNNKYRLPLNKNLYYNLLTFLETNAQLGGQVIIYILQTYCEVRQTERGPMDQYSFEAIVNQGRGLSAEDADLQEGIPGAFTGVTNKDIMDNSAVLKLGLMEMEPDLVSDVRAELEEEDAINPPPHGKSSLVEEFDRKIKRENSADGPSRAEIPLPPSRARDVVMEVQKIKENRDRFRIEMTPEKSGIAPGVSICMFTFHNTLDSITCIEFSDDNNLVAVGTQESFIRVWSLHGDPLPTLVRAAQNDPPTSSRRLIGHSAPVYAVSFSPSIEGPAKKDALTPSTHPRNLLSCSSDNTVRLWSLETWTSLVVYRSFAGPVWQVKWGPFGHYFAACSHDRTVRVWAQDKITPVRMMVGHDTSCNQLAWHPNGAYIFSASDQADKTIRMWSVSTGECVRMFTGHNDMLSSLECAPNGRILASGDISGNIIFWDLESGKQIKRCRGHGKGGIHSLSFSVETSVLVSGGQDGTVRVWDVAVPTDPHKAEAQTAATGGSAGTNRVDAGTGAAVPPASVGAKKKGKETMITPDQLSAFPTKKTPVYKVKFTRMNLIMASGPFLP